MAITAWRTVQVAVQVAVEEDASAGWLRGGVGACKMGSPGEWAGRPVPAAQWPWKSVPMVQALMISSN